MSDSEKSAVTSAPEKTRDNQASRPNWVEVATLIAVIAGIAGAGWQYIAHGHQRDQLERREAIVRVNEAETQVVSIAAQIRPPEAHFVRENVTFFVYPVALRVTNNGRLPIHIGDIRLRVYSAPLAKVAKLQGSADVGDDFQQIVLAAGAESSLPENAIGVIDLKSANWVEVLSHSLVSSLQSGTIPRSEDRQVTFHLLVRHSLQQRNFSDQVQRVVVTVSPAKNEDWGEQSWFGFLERSFCVAEPFPPGITTDEPVAAPELLVR